MESPTARPARRGRHADVRRALTTGLAVLAVAFHLAATAQPAAAQAYRRPLQRLADPQELAEPRRAPFTITPSITIAEEYNDNVLLNNDNKQWDFITFFTPGIAVEAEGPTYRLVGSYYFTSEIYARESRRSHAFDRHNLELDALYRLDPRTTLTLTDALVFDTNTNLIAPEGVATGRDRAWGNTLSPGVSWQADPRTTLRGGASWSVLRFDSAELIDSDVYRAFVAVDRAVTPRLTGSLSYEYNFFDIERQQNAHAHIPRVGATYRFTPTLTGSLAVGPIVEIFEDDETRITPAVTAGLRQRMPWGAVGLLYDRSLGTGGGLGGPTENQTIGAFVEVTTLMRGLTIDVGPRYSIVESARGNAIDVESFTFPVTATYRVTPWLAFVGSYIFFHQRSDSVVITSSGTAIASDVDQNRVWVGVQLGYPIRFD